MVLYLRLAGITRPLRDPQARTVFGPEQRKS